MKIAEKYSRNALLGSFVSMLTAGLATMMYSVCLGTIQTELSLTAAQSGSLATYTFMGQLLGGMVAGYIADRIGRKRCSLWMSSLQQARCSPPRS